MDAFTLTILIIFGGAIIGALLSARARDRCLKNWQDYQVTLEEKDGQRIWGQFKLYPTGFELEYHDAVRDRDGHLESSYILYKDQYPTIQALYRYPEKLEPPEQRRRASELKKLKQHVFIRRTKRQIQNLFSLLKDAIAETFSVVLGKVKTGRLGSVITKTGAEHAEKVSRNIIGYAGTSFDPLLERHLYRRVVLELTESEQQVELAGILKEYSSQFLEVVAVTYQHAEIDLIVPRTHSLIRHSAEPKRHSTALEELLTALQTQLQQLNDR